MNRRIERILMFTMGVWQIVDGMYTILYYGVFKSSFLVMTNHEYLQTPINSEFLFICTFGTLLVVLGISNLLVSKKYMKDYTVQKKFGYFLLVQALFSYFIFDILSLIIGMSAGVIYFAKNKSIKQLTRKGR